MSTSGQGPLEVDLDSIITLSWFLCLFFYIELQPVYSIDNIDIPIRSLKGDSNSACLRWN